MSPTRRLFRRALQDPRRATRVVWSLVKGRFYTTWYRVLGVRVRAGRNFRVMGRLDVRGPGEVIFGDNCLVNGHATPWTHTPEARIVIGNNVILNSARFGCAQEITIGDDCLLASVSIADTDFHSVRADRRTAIDAPVRVMPVHVGRNVWIGESAGLLPGTSIGENSVVGFGAVCSRAYPANVVLVGNPAKVSGQVAPASEPRKVCEPIAAPVGVRSMMLCAVFLPELLARAL